MLESAVFQRGAAHVVFVVVTAAHGDDDLATVFEAAVFNGTGHAFQAVVRPGKSAVRERCGTAVKISEAQAVLGQLFLESGGHIYLDIADVPGAAGINAKQGAGVYPGAYAMQVEGRQLFARDGAAADFSPGFLVQEHPHKNIAAVIKLAVLQGKTAGHGFHVKKIGAVFKSAAAKQKIVGALAGDERIFIVAPANNFAVL